MKERRDILGRAFVSFMVLFLLCCIPNGAQSPSPTPSGPTLSRKDADLILLMVARENPYYDLALVIDVSDSMSKILEEWKKFAEAAVDLTRIGDNLILVRFDSTPRTPLIQEIHTERDKQLFKGLIRKTRTTKGWGTDIHNAYYSTIKTLAEINKGREKKGELVRIQHIIFVSDGDDLPPDASPFRNPGSQQSLELEDYIKSAQKEQRINIKPMGMEFVGYRPKTRMMKTENVQGSDKVSKELQKFVEQMKDILKRPEGGISSDTERVSRAPYDFYIDWLSNRLEILSAGDRPGPTPYSRILTFQLRSLFREVQVKDLAATCTIAGSGGGSVRGGGMWSNRSIPPGGSSTMEVEVDFPKNWTLEPQKYQAGLEVRVQGNMEIAVGEEHTGPVPSPSLRSASSRRKVYAFPFNEKTVSASLAGELPVAWELVALLGGGGGIALIAILAAIFMLLIPIRVTLKTESKARAFLFAHGKSISLGDPADFQLEGCQGVVAEIKRSLRNFLLWPKKEGLVEGASPAKPMMLKIGQSFSLNADGTYHTVQFLPGDQEVVEPEPPPSAEPEEPGGEFKF